MKNSAEYCFLTIFYRKLLFKGRLRSSWEILRADRPLRELYSLLHANTVPDDETLNPTITAVLDKGAEIIRLAKEERRKYDNG